MYPPDLMIAAQTGCKNLATRGNMHATLCQMVWAQWLHCQALKFARYPVALVASVLTPASVSSLAASFMLLSSETVSGIVVIGLHKFTYKPGWRTKPVTLVSRYATFSYATAGSLQKLSSLLSHLEPLWNHRMGPPYFSSFKLREHKIRLDQIFLLHSLKHTVHRHHRPLGRHCFYMPLKMEMQRNKQTKTRDWICNICRQLLLRNLESSTPST